jgi:hypothetical protein
VDLYLQLLAGHLALRQLPQAKFLISILSPLLTAEQRECGSGAVPAAAGRSFGVATAAAGHVPNKHSISSVDS